jgi:hypothetical protein
MTTEDGGSTCSCNYAYTTPEGASESFDEPTTWTEHNLIRCSFANIPRTASHVDVRIHLTRSGTYSNTVRFRLSGTASHLDLTDPRSYVAPFRYQCRDSIFVPYPFPKVDSSQATVYDPLLSEDPSVATSLNFYASNMFAAAQAFLKKTEQLNQEGSGLVCPASPNDPGFGADLTVFSQGPDASDSERIFPAAGSAFDRSTFYLARQSTGIFNVPVNAYVAPASISSAPADFSAPNSNPDLPPSPLGYGAAPIPLGNGQERCPDTSVAIPPGFRWVKVFQFRASLNPRSVARSAKFSKVALSCNPGNWLGGGAPGSSAQVVPICAGAGAIEEDDTKLAARVLYTQSSGGTGSPGRACLALDHTYAPSPPVCTVDGIGPGSGAGCTADSSGTQKASYSEWPTASDVWLWYSEPGTYCASGPQNDPIGICSLLSSSPAVSVPTDQEIEHFPIEDSARYDFLLVVTPTNVHYQQMLDPSNAAAQPYLPYRFHPGKCVSGNPSAPAFAGDCDPAYRINYALKSHDVNDNGDAPPDQTGRLPTFPVCALQPIQ